MDMQYGYTLGDQSDDAEARAYQRQDSKQLLNIPRGAASSPQTFRYFIETRPKSSLPFYSTRLHIGLQSLQTHQTKNVEKQFVRPSVIQTAYPHVPNENHDLDFNTDSRHPVQ